MDGDRDTTSTVGVACANESGLVEGEIGVVKVDRTPDQEFSAVDVLGYPSMNSPKTAVVTGAASGIGRSLARLLYRQGYRLVVAWCCGS